jgi:hypothetical protein
LAAAVGYTSGTKLVSLGIYDTNQVTDSVGDPLPGGQASTSRIPDLGECCQLTKVTLPKDGVLLFAHQLYWLVVGPDNDQAPDFRGAWQLSNFAASANFTPDRGWFYPSGQWPAAEIRGAQAEESQLFSPDHSQSDSDDVSNTVIYTNLDRSFDSPYLVGFGALVSGDQVPFEPEAWQALPFVPRIDVHAKTLAAAIAWVSGTKLVNLGIYADNAGKVGTPLPGGQGSTSNIPDLGECCGLTKVKLPGPGVQLLAGTQYWLVASPDDTLAPTFQGAWQGSSLAFNAYQQPEEFVNWTDFEADWLATEIRGTSP